MRVAYYYHTPAINRHGQVVTNALQARVVEDLARNVDSVVLLAHRPWRKDYPTLDTPVGGTNVELVRLPPLPRSMLAWPLGPLYLALVHLGMRGTTGRRVDLTIVRAPSTLAGWISRAVPGPTIVLIVGSFTDWARSPRRSRWVRHVAMGFGRLMRSEVASAARTGAVFSNSHEVVGEWEAAGVDATYVSTNPLLRGEAATGPRRREDAIIRLLFVGRIEREKGILQALDVCSILQEQGLEVALRAVGPRTDGAIQLPDVPWAVFVGTVPYGTELFHEFRRSDVLLCLSEFESFPRVIWESLALGTPVIATDVGSIRTTLGDDVAVIVPPQDATSAATAVAKLMADEADRTRRIQRGLEAFESMTSRVPTVGEATRDAGLRLCSPE